MDARRPALELHQRPGRRRRPSAPAFRPRSRARRLVLGALARGGGRRRLPRLRGLAARPRRQPRSAAHGAARAVRRRRRRDGGGTPAAPDTGRPLDGRPRRPADARPVRRAPPSSSGPDPGDPGGALTGRDRPPDPLDALRIVGGGSLPLRADYLFHELAPADAHRHTDRCHGESAVVQYQLLLHKPAGKPLGAPPVLVLATPDDRLIPIRGIRSTSARYGATLQELPGMGHDLMLDARWREPFDAMIGWLRTAVPAA